MRRRYELPGRRALRRRALYSREARRYFAAALEAAEEIQEKVVDVLNESLEEQSQELAELLDSPEMEEVEELAAELEMEQRTESRRSRLLKLRSYARGRRYYSESGDFDPSLLDKLLERVQNAPKVPAWARPIVSKFDKLVAAIKVFAMRPSVARQLKIIAGIIGGVVAILSSAFFMSFLKGPLYFVHVMGGVDLFAAFLGIAVLVATAIGAGSALEYDKSEFERDLKKAEGLVLKFAEGGPLTKEEVSYLKQFAPSLSEALKEALKKKILG
ncbi:MAG: hypothetical protein KatS3mg101_1136 [Patescibacteria group bacterium]|nr:MAG: hypothetical protein KatS3mg101_1136 [Patescibacteria group bacterium]